MFHLFVHVVRSRQDAFAGIRGALDREGVPYADLSLAEDELDTVDAVEYTWRRPFRSWFYRHVFASLERRLDVALAAHPGPVCVYFTDEGVWAVVWDLYRRRLGRRNVRSVNVQHGFALLKAEDGKARRRMLNGAAIALTGYPNFGYGSLGGAGPGPFDVYLTYDEATADFARRQSGRAAAAAPHLIKHELWERFDGIRKDAQKTAARVLFAMNMDIAGSPVLCGAGETLDVLLPLARLLEVRGARFMVRLHPGMEQAKEAARFAAHPISRLATLDPHPDLHASMAQTDIVMSYVSTALWEGGLLGLEPVQVACRCCRPIELGYPREVLDLDGHLEGQVARILATAKKKKTVAWPAEEAKEWAAAKHLIYHGHDQ